MVEIDQSFAARDNDATSMPLKEIQKRLGKAASSPAVCGLRVARAAGLVAETLQWKGDTGRSGVDLSEGEAEKLHDRLHDLLRLLLITANCVGVDVSEAAGLKMAKNKRKYPADIVRGSSAKYDEYKSYSHARQAGGALEVHAVETLGQMAEEMSNFAKARDWLQYHTPRNLTLALCGEVGELCELLVEPEVPSMRLRIHGGQLSLLGCYVFYLVMADNRMLLPHLLDAGTHSPKVATLSNCSRAIMALLSSQEVVQSSPSNNWDSTGHTPATGVPPQEQMACGMLAAVYPVSRAGCGERYSDFLSVVEVPGRNCRGISCMPAPFQPLSFRRPLVGVLTLPCGKLCPAGGGGYIAASYVKWLEAAGAQVVPIPHYGSRDEVSTLLGMVSGVLFTGGGGQGLLWDNLTKWIIEARQTAELQGLPVFGTCLGFERIMQVAAKNDSILEQTPGADDVSLTLRWTKHEDSVMESDHYFSEVKKATEARNMTYNHHDWGVWLDQLHMYPEAMVDLRVLATSRSFGSERDFVAVVEGRNALDGVWAVQFHPEKPSFEWNSKLSIDHSRISVAANRFFGDFFLDGVRTHIPRDGCSTVSEEAPALIYNYPLVFTGWRNSTGKPREGYFTETYFV
ncbi:hypothetical protein FOL47_005097 [Perkinsus chesapeaki]|uniref:folate gamma-glutamyl hydrolase n=1 Tax=Perkinsus chesapeaki TaxID=330153 RepID=A0A7J6LZ89_PERCH|nr:hypothetical protein FOL47_005097 [Perkinsus chesapeaki]